MSWTEQRVERLGKLWKQGLSASVIAAELGEGVSRNAVIGKIHRLGLSDRSVPAAAPEAERARIKPLIKAPSASAASETVLPVVPLPAATGSDVVIPFSSRVTIMELRESMCRWPFGDPASSEFRFCGCRKSGGIPYCAPHASVAFQPLAERRRVERVARIS